MLFWRSRVFDAWPYGQAVFWESRVFSGFLQIPCFAGVSGPTARNHGKAAGPVSPSSYDHTLTRVTIPFKCGCKEWPAGLCCLVARSGRAGTGPGSDCPGSDCPGSATGRPWAGSDRARIDWASRIGPGPD